MDHVRVLYSRPVRLNGCNTTATFCVFPSRPLSSSRLFPEFNVGPFLICDYRCLFGRTPPPLPFSGLPPLSFLSPPYSYRKSKEPFHHQPHLYNFPLFSCCPNLASSLLFLFCSLTPSVVLECRVTNIGTLTIRTIFPPTPNTRAQQY